MGESSGGMMAASFAATFPERVTHLVTLGGYVDGRSLRENAGEDAILQMAQSGWNTPGSAFVTGYLSVYFPDAPPETWANWGQMIQSSCPIENEVRERASINQHSIATELENIRAPALVIHSRDDAVHPLSEGQKMARGIPNAELLIMESRNHITLHSDPQWEEMMEAIRAFLMR